MRLRFALFLEDLAQRFNLPISPAHRLLQKGLNVMYTRLSFLIAWPSREIMSWNMPAVVKQLYPASRCIIDCTEVFIESPNNFEARAKVYSHYKNHSTVKFLIGITPCGAISNSRCWGGRVSDKSYQKFESMLGEQLECSKTSIIIILKGTLPVDILRHNGDTDIANIDKIIVVCAALTNISIRGLT